MQLSDLIRDRFGVTVTAVVNPVTAALSTTAALVLKNNPNRVGWIIYNLSSEVIYFSLQQDVSTTKGFYVDKNGGSLSMIWTEDFDVTSMELWGIASTATPDILVIEYEIT